MSSNRVHAKPSCKRLLSAVAPRAAALAMTAAALSAPASAQAATATRQDPAQFAHSAVTAAYGQANYKHYVWADSVNVRNCPWLSCSVGAKINNGNYWFVCQKKAGTVYYLSYANNWWALVDLGYYRGWVSDIFLSGGSNWSRVPGIPVC
jgi:hypothetical protein